MRFDGEVVLITGGNRGIGLAAARAFAAAGAAVALAARDEPTEQARAQEVKGLFIPVAQTYVDHHALPI